MSEERLDIYNAASIYSTLVSRPRNTIRTLTDKYTPKDYTSKEIRDAFEC